jgi:predicted Fe-Mo cluster-binding NifX family protein
MSKIIAVATEDGSAGAQISQRGAKASCFQLFDAQDGRLDVLDNPYAANARHVGPDVALLLRERRVTCVVAGRFGPRFQESLGSLGIECVERTGLAADAVKALLE